MAIIRTWKTAKMDPAVQGFAGTYSLKAHHLTNAKPFLIILPLVQLDRLRAPLSKSLGALYFIDSAFNNQPTNIHN